MFEDMKLYGFLPKPEEVSKKLRNELSAWESVGSQLPELILNNTVRAHCRELPIINVTDLNINECNRLLIIFGYLAHACHYECKNNNIEEDLIPGQLFEMWKTLSDRLKRPGPALTIYDAVINNWRLKSHVNPETVNYALLKLDDIEPIVSAFNSDAERIFHLTILLMEMRAIPLVASVINLAEAITSNNIDTIIQELDTIFISLISIKTALSAINLNPLSKTYVDPIVWCNQIATFTSGIPPHDPGMSGIGSPLFHLLDALVGREKYKSKYGQMAMVYFEWLLPKHQQLIEKIKEGNFFNVLANMNNKQIDRALKSITQAYAGQGGLLEKHQLKALGYVKLMQLTRRKKTNANTDIESKNAASHISNDFSASTKERLTSDTKLIYAPASKTIIKKIELDDDSSISYVSLLYPGVTPGLPAGSLCQILAVNSDSDCDRVMRNLELQDSLGQLPEIWKNFFAKRNIALPTNLKEVLKFSELEQLQNLYSNVENIYDCLTPSSERCYSIISEKYHDDKDETDIRLLVKASQNGQVSCSLANEEIQYEHISFTACYDSNDALEVKHALMLGGGVGISGLISHCRHYQANGKKLTLMLSVRNMAECNLYQEIIEKTFNVEDAEIIILATCEKKLITSKANDTDYVEVILNEKTSILEHISRHLVDNQDIDLKDNVNTKIHICGSQRFTTAVSNTLTEIISLKLDKSLKEGSEHLNTMIANKNIVVSSGFTKNNNSVDNWNMFSITQLLTHNNSKQGYWIVINNSIYDVSRFINIHPGGNSLIKIVAGTDATQDFRAIHRDDTKVHAQLNDFYIGRFNEPEMQQIKEFLFTITRIENGLTIIRQNNNVDLYLLRLYEIDEVIRKTLLYLIAQINDRETQLYSMPQQLYDKLYKTIKDVHDSSQEKLISILKSIKILKGIMLFIKNHLQLLIQSENLCIDHIQCFLVSFGKNCTATHNSLTEVHTQKKEYVIVGAGLTGLILAMLLKKLNLNVSIYEKYIDPRMQDSIHQSASFNITLSERGLNVLRVLNLEEKIFELAIPVYGRRIHLEGDSFNQDYGPNAEALYSIGRDCLVKLLTQHAESLGVELYFSHELLEISIEENDIKLQIHNKLHKRDISIIADKVFGADGVNSQVRDQIEKLNPDHQSSIIKTHNMIYREIILPAGSNPSLKLEANRLHIWPRENFMLIAFPNNDSSFTMSLFVDKTSQDLIDITEDTSQFQKLVSGHCPEIQQQLQFILKNEADHRWGELKCVNVQQWYYQDKILLLGDAAHAFYPFYGQAANCSFVDCLNIYTNLCENKSWNDVFESHQARKIHTDHIAKLASIHSSTLSNKIKSTVYKNQSAIENEFTRLAPNFRSTYSNISFTSMPYLEADESGQPHRIMVELVMEYIRENEINDLFETEILHSLVKSAYDFYINNDIQKIESDQLYGLFKDHVSLDMSALIYRTNQFVMFPNGRNTNQTSNPNSDNEEALTNGQQL